MSAAGADRRSGVLLLSLGLEPRDRAVQVIARRLREAGHDVVVGSRADARSLVEGVADDESVVIGMSLGRGADGALAALLDVLAARRGARRVFVGGRIDADHGARLARQHRVHIFPPDVTTSEVVAWVEDRNPAKPDRR
jgi:methylmalonyl-CoA mutase cobalamin-binding domain/chain